MGEPPRPPDRTFLEQVRDAFARPGTQIVLCGVLLALAFPARSSGAIGLTIIAGALGVGVALLWPRAPEWLRKPPSDVTSTLVLVIVACAGLTVFWEVMTESPDWQLGDWGPHHAVLARIMPSLPGLDVPVWNHALSTGDAPLELYPAFTHLLTGHVAIALGLENDLPLALMVMAVLTYLVICVATTAVAMLIAPKPIALVVGLLTLVDSGAIAHGGTVGLFRWALLHSAISLAFSTIAALAVLGALRKPRIGMSVLIWVFTALATASHPAGLLATATTVVALAAVALLASDLPPRRALAAIGHVAIGAALGAAVWMPLAARILEYGQHYPNAIRSPVKLIEDLLQSPSPHTAFSMLVYAGYFGLIAGLWSRKAATVFVSATALVLLVGLCDVAYMAFDLAPGQGAARLGTERLAQLARPFVMAAAAYGIAIFVGTAINAWKGAGRNQRLIAAAIVGIMTATVMRSAPSTWWNAANRASNEARAYPSDWSGRQQLTRWARIHALTITPGTWARAVFETDTHEHMHLTAETGLPTFHNSWLPDLLLRERIEDLSEESLRRFNVRWIITPDKEPSFGDAATETKLGTFRIREVPGWDGQFARIERGTGQVRTLRLDDRAVEIEVTGTTEPVLVALGTGYYPRWRATHASGTDEPVFALPSKAGAKLHVVSAWVAPGKTTFTCDGPLPSDHKGRWVSILAALAAITGIVFWSRRKLRIPALRRLARLRARAPRIAELAVRYGIPTVCILLLVRGCVESRQITRSIELGSGLLATATVEGRSGEGEWETCSYSRTDGGFSCHGLLEAHDAMTTLLNDAMPSWAFNTPGFVASGDVSDAEIRVKLRAHLDGTYWIATNGTATLSVEGEEDVSITRKILVFGDNGERDITIRALLPLVDQFSFTFVREDTILPERKYLDAPPVEAPPEVRAIR
ncbi:MAG: hypothetical protein H0T46_14910 [Deltaproteobacteria bacterium]|nr:hypothetical protein [Deltaproteobacteria bacterium]